MTISVRELHPLFVGAVSGVDIHDQVDQETVREIERALDRYAVLVFRGQPLTDKQQIAFSGLFGPLETAFGSIRKGRESRLGNRLLADVSNLDGNGEIRSRSDPWRLMQLGNQLWHTDSSYKRVPGKISFCRRMNCRVPEARPNLRICARLMMRSIRQPENASKIWWLSIPCFIRAVSSATPTSLRKSALRIRRSRKSSSAFIQAPVEKHSTLPPTRHMSSDGQWSKGVRFSMA